MNSQHFRRFAVLMIASIIALSACARSTEMPKDETTHDFTASQEIETIPDTSREDLSPSYPVTSLTINGIDLEQYVIACRASAGGVITHAASELQRYLAATTGVRLPIVKNPVETGVKRIFIDETIVTDDNNFKIFSDSDGIVLAGSAKRSALYAVYHFLEQCLGWTFFTADTEICATAERLDLRDTDIDFVHPFAIRDIYWTEYFDEDISVKRYQNGEGKRRKMFNDNPASVALGGSESFHAYGVHTFGELAEQDSSTQPCLNDEAVYQTMLKNVIAWLSADASRDMIHVSQNDNTRYCTCSLCQADLQKYGSLSGSIIKLVNRMDEDLKARGYEDVTIVTFAYRYSFPCPKNITCNANVAIELCTIDYCFNHAFDDLSCAKNVSCMAEIRAWADICEQFYIWDYTVNFKYYLSPFPNFDVLLDNMRVMSTIGAKGLLAQGNFQTVSGEFGALRCYLLAKALENPNMSDEEFDYHTDAFLAAYYGPGWQYVKHFLDFITELSNARNTCYGIYASPEDIYGDHAFSPYNDQLIEWWDRAEEMAETPLQLEHVRRSRICCDYLRIGSIFAETQNSGNRKAIKKLHLDIKGLYEACQELGVTRIAENFPLPTSINYDQNPRAWWALHEYVE